MHAAIDAEAPKSLTLLKCMFEEAGDQLKTNRGLSLPHPVLYAVMKGKETEALTLLSHYSSDILNHKVFYPPPSSFLLRSLAPKVR